MFLTQVFLEHHNTRTVVFLSAVYVATGTVGFVGFAQPTGDAVLLFDVFQNGRLGRKVAVAIFTVGHGDCSKVDGTRGVLLWTRWLQSFSTCLVQTYSLCYAVLLVIADARGGASPSKGKPFIMRCERRNEPRMRTGCHERRT